MHHPLIKSSIFLIVATFSLCSPMAAKASGLVHWCHAEKEKIQASAADLNEKAKPVIARNRALISWFETASRDEIIEIWGEPVEAYGGLGWSVATEFYEETGGELFRENDLWCILRFSRSAILLVPDLPEPRAVRRVIGRHATHPSQP